MRENHIRILCSVLKVDLVFEKQDGTRAAFFDNTARSPLMQSDYLRRTLRDGIEGQNTPFLLKGSYDCYYACLRAEGGLMYMGPMCHERLGPVKRRQMLRVHGIEANDPPAMPTFTLSEMRNMVLLVNSALENATLENEELLQLNRLINEADRNYQQEQAQFMMKEEAEDDSDAWRHSYEEEQLLLQAVREGRAEDAVRLAEGMDRDTGRLSSYYSRSKIASIIHCLEVMLRTISQVRLRMVSHKRSMTHSRVLKTSFLNPIERSCFQICSMGFISGV